jgi:hypothetical protein
MGAKYARIRRTSETERIIFIGVTILRKSTILLIIVLLFFSFYIWRCWEKKNQTIDFATYSEDMLRFTINIDKNRNYLFAPESELYGEFDDDIFNKNAKKITFNKSSLRFGKYLFTKNNEYLYTNTGLENGYGWIKCNVPLKTEYKKYIETFFVNKESNMKIHSLEVVPFNNPLFVLLSGRDEQYILNLKAKKINWTRGYYYESPYINFKNDLLECGGDLSSSTFLFDKYGKLKESFL